MGQYHQELHHRRSIRLKNYDYSKKGAYFVTICTKHGTEFFGAIKDGVMQLSEEGLIAQRLWYTLSQRFPGIELDDFVFMPNHMHGIIVRSQEISLSATVGVSKLSPARSQPEYLLEPYRTNPKRSQKLSEIVRTFKGVTSYTLRRNGAPEFAWHRDYWEHVIRNEKELERIRLYMVNNPQTWHKDTLNIGIDGKSAITGREGRGVR
jgi:putative transposase